MLQEEWLCILSDGDYFELVPYEFIDEIHASFSNITFNHPRTINFYDVLLEESEMQLTFRNFLLIKE